MTEQTTDELMGDVRATLDSLRKVSTPIERHPKWEGLTPEEKSKLAGTTYLRPHFEWKTTR